MSDGGGSAAAAAMGLPPLSLSTGPAVSGGNPATGGATDGTFSVNFGGAKSAPQMLVSELPLLVIGGLAAWLLISRRK